VRTKLLVILAVVLLLFVGLTSVREPASAALSSSIARYAPLDQPGPTLDISRATVRKNLVCSHPKAPRGRPVLVVPGTGTIPSVDYGWNYERAFTAKHIAWCALTLPESANGDIQVAGEYVVSAIRVMASASGRKIDVFGWSQGGMVPRWALRFWPDTRALVANVVGLAPSNHGTIAVADVCRIACLPALRQQGTMSHFILALNSYAETFPASRTRTSTRGTTTSCNPISIRQAARPCTRAAASSRTSLYRTSALRIPRATLPSAHTIRSGTRWLSTRFRTADAEPLLRTSQRPSVVNDINTG
jgi:hypothetical protein